MSSYGGLFKFTYVDLETDVCCRLVAPVRNEKIEDQDQERLSAEIACLFPE